MADELDDFVEFDATMGSQAVNCPECGEKIGSSLLLDHEIECPKCGHTFSIGG